MNSDTLDSLLKALAATPHNLDLRRVIARTYFESGAFEEAYELLTEAEPRTLRGEDRTLLAELAVKLGKADEGLEHADGDEPEMLLAQARSLAALDRRAEALELYRRAVAANPALEDLDLKGRLAANVRTFPGRDDGNRPRLTVISNDRTDATEIKRLLIPETERINFSHVGGLEGVKAQIEKRIILPFQKPSLFQRFKRQAGGGILLYGPPGCGKTMLARATAGECNASFWNVAINDILDMWIGESERKLAAIFAQAREKVPAVLFFDELEALGGKREHTREATSSKLVSTFLAEMDGFAQNNQGVLVLAATNVPWAIDPAFRRSGRFDRVLFVPPPDRPARRAILELLLAERPTAERLNLEGLASATAGFSGADLKNLVDTASDFAIEATLEAGTEVPIDDALLKRAVAELKPTTLEWLTTARNYARYANEGGQYDEVLEFLKAHGKN